MDQLEKFLPIIDHNNVLVFKAGSNIHGPEDRV
jgi:hypothetical protein